MDKERKLAIEIKLLDNMISRNIINNCKRDNISNISHIQGAILRYLFKNKKHIIYQGDIEKEFDIRRSTVSGILDTMEKNTLIKRINSIDDCRKKEIILTDKSIKEAEFMKKHVSVFENKIKKNITEEELIVFYSVIDKIKNNLKGE